MYTTQDKRSTIWHWLCIIIGTIFFTGYFPLAPATVSSFFSLILVIFLSKNNLIYTVVLVGIVVLGAIIADTLEKVWSKDARRITIDECAGIMITFFYLPIRIAETGRINWLLLVIGFILFRIFDISKPLYIRASEKISGGVGIMLDDIISGIYSNIILRALLLMFQLIK